MCEEKKRVAVASLVALGIGAAYLLKDDLIKSESVEDSKMDKELITENPEKVSEEIRSATTDTGGVRTEERESFPGPQIFNVSWEYLRRTLGSQYPGDDMSRIYPMLDEKLRMSWRRGIYNKGPRSYVDKLFVYYDAYYLVLAGWEELRSAFNSYATGKTDFNIFFRSYTNVARKLLSVYS